MFTLLHQSNRLAIRLPEDKRRGFLKKYKTTLFEAQFSYEYAKSLKSKPTRKKS